MLKTVLGGLILAFSLLLTCPVQARMDTEMADPPPSMDEPRKVLLGLNTKDPQAVNNLLYNAVNVQKFYGMDNVQIVVVAWGAGVRALLKESSPVAERVSSLQQYGVTFLACGNTLDTLHKSQADLLDDVEVVQAGIPEVVERRLNGWIDIIP
ncbi:DsrE family protein [Magnetospira thiophila]